jgi:ribosomal protein L37AE/L43A
MAPSSLQPHVTAVLDHEPDTVHTAVCPMCQTSAALTAGAAGAWRCVRCGQHWDAERLAAFSAYTAWVVERDATTTVKESHRLLIGLPGGKT